MTALAEAASLLAETLHYIPDAYAVIDEQGVVRVANQAARTLLTPVEATPVGRSITHYLADPRLRQRCTPDHFARWAHRLARGGIARNLAIAGAAGGARPLAVGLSLKQTAAGPLFICSLRQPEPSQAAPSQAAPCQPASPRVVHDGAADPLVHCDQIVSLAEDAILSIDSQQRIIQFNFAAQRVFGYRADEVMGQPLTMLIPSRYHDSHAHHVSTFKGEHRTARMMSERGQVVGLRRDGEEFPAEAAISRYETPAGPVFSVCLRDISERQTIERALKESEACLANAQRIAHLGSWEWLTEEDELSWSDETFRILGFEPRSLKPSREAYIASVLPDDREAVSAATRATLKSLAPFSIDHRIIRPDGEIRFVHAQGQVTLAAEGRVVRIAGTMQDVTARKHDEAKLADLNRRLADKNRQLDIALENTQNGLALYDDKRRLVLWNRQYQTLYRLPKGALRPGMPLADVIEAAEIANGLPMALAAEVMLQRLALAESKESQQFLQRLADGTVIDGLHQPLPDGFLIATLTNVTERERREAELTRAMEAAEGGSRAKSEFLATMSHELRTPLNAIIGFAEMLVGEVVGPLESRYRSYAEDIAASGQHLLAVINAILDMSKIEAGRFQLSESEFALAGVVQGTVRVLKGRATEAGLTLHVEVPGSLVLRADERILSQILINLLSNAVKFTPAGGEIRVSAEMRRDGLALSVSDTGIGIARADIPKTLLPFGQIDSSLSRKYAGTGLGLPLVKSLVELHGGRLTIDSALGLGTTVTALFPPQRSLDLGATEAHGEAHGEVDCEVDCEPDSEPVSRASSG